MGVWDRDILIMKNMWRKFVLLYYKSIRRLYLHGILRRGYARGIVIVASIFPSTAYMKLLLQESQAPIWIDLRLPSCIPLFLNRSLSSSSELFFQILASRWQLFVDVGAHIGVVSVTVAANHKDCTCIAFEPLPSSFAVLQRNSHIYPSIIAKNYAVGEFPGRLQLFLAKSEAENSTTRPQVCGSNIRFIEVPSVTLDDYFLSHNLPIPDMIKVDVEGGEYEVLRGARRLIALSDKPPAWFIEVNTEFLHQRNLSIEAIENVLNVSRDRNCYHRFIWDAQQRLLVPCNIDMNSGFRGNIVYIPESRVVDYEEFIR